MSAKNFPFTVAEIEIDGQTKPVVIDEASSPSNSGSDEYEVTCGDYGSLARVNGSGSVDLAPLCDIDGASLDDDAAYEQVKTAVEAHFGAH